LKKRDVIARDEILDGTLIARNTVIAKGSPTHIMEISLKDAIEYEEVSILFYLISLQIVKNEQRFANMHLI